MPDFFIQQTSSNFVVLHPTTDEAKTWLDDHVADEAQWWAGGLVVEHRYISDLLNGITDHGMTVSFKA